MLTVRCKICNKELSSQSSQAKCCGCPNMTTITGNKISAVNLSDVVMLNSLKEKTKNTVFSPEELAYQEARRQRKVRKLDFEVR
jgi:hypothetical protein